MAARIRYRDFHDEQAIVVTLIAPDAVRGSVDALRPPTYRANDDLQVAERSLENLFSALRETQKEATARPNPSESGFPKGCQGASLTD